MDLHTDWAAWIVPCISGAVGVGVAWGIFKQRLESYGDKITKIELKLENQVGAVGCEHIREQCRSTIKDSVDLIRIEVIANREIVVNELREIHKFMGRLDGERK